MARLLGARRAAILPLCLGLALLATPVAAHAQSAAARIRQERDSLERVRQEREALERQARELQGRMRDLSEDVANLDRQADVTARALAALDRQMAALNDAVDETTGAMLRAEDERATKRAILRRRVTDIYKRGPLGEAEALLSVRSFGDLVSRYKYLYLVAQRDRALLERVGTLRNQIDRQRQQLVSLQAAMQRSREEKAAEEERLRSLQRERAQSLANAQRQAARLEARVREIRRDEARLASAIERLEAERRRAEAAARTRPDAPAPSSTRSTLKTGDFGKLAWPVDGNILYQFGRVVNPNNTTTRWNGVGIAAPLGTPVKAVAAGEVAIAEPFGTYGLTVVIQHGGGDYSVYGSLNTSTVRKGTTVAAGEVIGTVGAADPDMPPHLHFEIRPRGRAMDPLTWLRAQR